MMPTRTLFLAAAACALGTASAHAIPLATFSIDGTDPAARIAGGAPVQASSTAAGVSVSAGISGVSAVFEDGNLVAATNPSAQDASFRGPFPGTPNNSAAADGLIAFGIREQARTPGGNGLAGVLASGQGLSFSITADAGSELDLNGGSLTVDYATGTPGNQATNVALFSSVNGFDSAGDAVEVITGIPTSSTVNQTGLTNVQSLSFDFDGSEFDDLEGDVDFRLVFFGAQFDLLGNNNRRFNTVNNVVLNGEVAVVPEPASAALLAAGLGVMLLRKRSGN